MKSQIKKLVASLVLCGAGIAASEFWYQWDYSKNLGAIDGNQKQVAELVDTTNLVQKKPAKKLVWRRAELNDSLFSGESVRTVSDSSAVIQFSNGATISLEPDSVVAIEEGDSKVNIDFIKGNVFVKGSSNTDSSLALKSGDTNIDLANAELAIGKNSDKEIDVQVFKGTAQVKGKGQTLTLDKTKVATISASGVESKAQVFKINSPLPNETIFLRSDKPQNVKFSFAPLGDQYDVQLYVGQSRTKLEPVGEKFSGDRGEVTAVVKPGPLFWKLEATEKKNPKASVTSVVQRAKVVVETPPQPIWPGKDETVALSNTQDMKVTLRWANPSKLESLQLQIGTDPTFQKNVFSGPVEDIDYLVQQLEKDGTYHWRVSGMRPKSQIMLTSLPQKFTVKSKIDLIPPRHQEPADQAAFSYESLLNSGMTVKWNRVFGMQKYLLRVESVPTGSEKPTIIEKEVMGATEVVLGDLKPGSYRWQLASFDPQSRRSEFSQPWIFKVGNLAKIKWAEEKADTYFYITPKPTLLSKWMPYAPKMKYRLTISGSALKEDLKFEVTQAEKLVDVPADSEYVMKLEGLNDQNQVVARADDRKISVGLKPLLPAPRFPDRMPSSLEATRQGAVTINWISVPKAKSYFLTIRSMQGKVLRKDKIPGNQASFKGLYPGQYKFALSSIDEHGREGPIGADRTFTVPDTSDLRAPGFKKLKIK